MLLIAAALLTASMHSFGVIEAPEVPASATTVVSSASSTRPADPVARRPVMTGVQVATGGATDAPAADEAPVDISPADAAPADAAPAAAVPAVGTAHGRAFLDALAALSPDALLVADRNADVLATAQDAPPTAADVAHWWAGLDVARRAVLVQDAPSVIGNLDGLPFAVRDRANRAVLDAGLAAGERDGGAETVAMLGQVRDALRHEPGDPYRSLVTLDTRGSGRAAVAIGDLDHAADVTVVVPGMFFTVTGQMRDFTDTANDLSAEQATLSGLARSGEGNGVAVVAWMGYRTPDLSNILSLDLAQTGAERLERAVDGLRTVRADEVPRVNVVAHSYGSTTALMALASGHMRADTLTVFGSPGSSVKHASELAVGAGQVFVGDAHSDPIAGSGYFGTDPGSAAFGSTVLDLAGSGSGGSGVAAAGLFRKPIGHNDYLKPGTASLHDVALIGIGRGDLVREQLRRGEHGGKGLPQTSPDMYLVRPQDLQQRD